jgi:methionyl-tRNA formyltransferase
VHASLLPKYRGAAPIQWAIARGETRTGVTTMKIDAGLDTGDMLLKWETEIGPEETAVELADRLAVAGADLLVRTLAELAGIVPQKQDEAQATYAPLLKKEDGEIDWTMFTRDILNRIRGFEPWPGCYTFWDGQRIRIWKAQRLDLPAPPQGWFARKKGQLTAGTGNGGIEILEVQLEGKKRMETAAFLNAFPDTESTWKIH